LPPSWLSFWASMYGAKRGDHSAPYIHSRPPVSPFFRRSLRRASRRIGRESTGRGQLGTKSRGESILMALQLLLFVRRDGNDALPRQTYIVGRRRDDSSRHQRYPPEDRGSLCLDTPDDCSWPAGRTSCFRRINIEAQPQSRSVIGTNVCCYWPSLW